MLLLNAGKPRSLGGGGGGGGGANLLFRDDFSIDDTASRDWNVLFGGRNISAAHVPGGGLSGNAVRITMTDHYSDYDNTNYTGTDVSLSGNVITATGYTFTADNWPAGFTFDITGGVNDGVTATVVSVSGNTCTIAETLTAHGAGASIQLGGNGPNSGGYQYTSADYGTGLTELHMGAVMRVGSSFFNALHHQGVYTSGLMKFVFATTNEIAPVNIVNVTQSANPIVTATGHGFNDGGHGIISDGINIPELQYYEFEVGLIDADSFYLLDAYTGLPVNTSAWTAYTGGGDLTPIWNGSRPGAFIGGKDDGSGTDVDYHTVLAGQDAGGSQGDEYGNTYLNSGSTYTLQFQNYIADWVYLLFSIKPYNGANNIEVRMWTRDGAIAGAIVGYVASSMGQSKNVTEIESMILHYYSQHGAGHLGVPCDANTYIEYDDVAFYDGVNGPPGYFYF